MSLMKVVVGRKASKPQASFYLSSYSKPRSRRVQFASCVILRRAVPRHDLHGCPFLLHPSHLALPRGAVCLTKLIMLLDALQPPNALAWIDTSSLDKLRLDLRTYSIHTVLRGPSLRFPP